MTLDVVDEPDTLTRISLLNDALLKLVAGEARLVEVRTADYRRGHMEVVVDAPERSRPPSLGTSVLVSARQ